MLKERQYPYITTCLSRTVTGIALTSHLSFPYLILSSLVLRTQTYDIADSTAGLSEGCHFDFLSSITISYMNNCSAVRLRATGSRGRRMELYTILWKNRRECCLRPYLTAIQTRFLVAPCEKLLQPLFSDFEFITFDLTSCFPLAMMCLKWSANP